MNAIDQRIADHGIALPEASPPMAALLKPTRLIGQRLVVSAQTPKLNGRIVFSGKVGQVHDLQGGQQAARLCALNVISHARTALGGDLGRIAAIVSVRGYVNVVPDFHQIAEVVNGASEVFLQIFGDEIGAHCRTSVGAANMPFDATVEIEAEFHLA